MLHVWVQPVDWVGVEEEKPIVELAVTSASYLGDKPVKGYVAVPSVHKPCTCSQPSCTYITNHID